MQIFFLNKLYPAPSIVPCSALRRCSPHGVFRCSLHIVIRSGGATILAKMRIESMRIYSNTVSANPFWVIQKGSSLFPKNPSVQPLLQTVREEETCLKVIKDRETDRTAAATPQPLVAAVARQSRKLSAFCIVSILQILESLNCDRGNFWTKPCFALVHAWRNVRGDLASCRDNKNLPNASALSPSLEEFNDRTVHIFV